MARQQAAGGLTNASNLNQHICKKTRPGSRTLNLVVSIGALSNSFWLAPILYLRNYTVEPVSSANPPGCCLRYAVASNFFPDKNKAGLLHET